MIEIRTEVILNGTKCFVWKDYYKNGCLMGFVIIARTYTSVHLCTKNNKVEVRFTR